MSRVALLARRCVPAVLLAALSLRAPGAAPAKGPPARGMVAVSYADLVPPDALLRNGTLLAEAAATATADLLQPHLAGYSSLLPSAVQLLSGEEVAPREDLADAHPPGSAQPAWAAILREGRIRISADRRGRARVFLPGDDPRAAWRAHYSLLRHPLGSLLPPGGGALLVEVYAYRNDYRSLELRVNPEPYRFRSRAFPPRGSALDREALERFFAAGGALEGAELDPEAGLVLYSRAAEEQTLAGAPPTLADFAVAYRAVFHAGDAPPFVSIDRHPDPFLGRVNFGGLLEDTRIGAVVLAADKRFKTVVSGLDPETGEDVRERVRRAVPGFLTNSERAFLLPDPAAEATWISTRYWFFPGSTGVDADRAAGIAAVTRPRFIADAERTGVDYRPEEARRRRLRLPAEVRANIRHLNENYARYAALFPELRELTVVARMIAVCAWLQKERPEWLDLDGLLAVELPPVVTAREVPYQLDAEYVLLPRSGAADAARVARESRVVHVNPLLERTVGEVFRSAEGFSVLLRLQGASPGATAEEIAAHADQAFVEARGRTLRELVRSEADLRALLRAVAQVSSRFGRADDGARLRGLMAERRALEPESEAGAARRARLDGEIAALMKLYHAGGAGGEPLRPVIHAGYTGGITMAPRLFAVQERADSPALQRLRQARAGAAGAADGSAAGWTRSAPVKRARAEAAPAPRKGSGVEPAPRPAQSPGGTDGRPEKAAAAPTRLPDARPGGRVPAGAEAAVEELGPAPQRPAQASSVIAARDPAGAAVTGRLQDGGRIVFTRAPQ